MRVSRWLYLLLFLLPLSVYAASGIALKDLNGKDRNLNDYVGKGKWTVVSVWSADCPICRREIYHMTFFHEEHKNKDAQVLGISIDRDRKKAQGFIDDQGLNFPNLLASADDVARISGRFVGTPTYFFFAPDGRLMSERVGPVTQAQAEGIISTLKAQLSSGGKPG